MKYTSKALLVLALPLAVAACASKSPYTFTNGGADTPAPKGKVFKLDFEATPPGALPSELVHVLGDWAVMQDGGNRVLVQSGDFGDPDFPRLIMKDVSFTNVHVKVRCVMKSGDTNRACGLMFRVKDSDNYYITRANTLEDNINLYRVVGGDRQQFAGRAQSMQTGAWTTLEAFAEGGHLRVLWNGVEVIAADDATFTSGKVGVWTKADSTTAFDDFEASEL